MKIMISQPMNGRTSRDIITQRDRAKKYLEAMGHEVIDSFISEDNIISEAGKQLGVEIKSVPLFYLSISLMFMSACDAVYFCDGWENARGCIIEHGAAKAYGLKAMYESDNASDLH